MIENRIEDFYILIYKPDHPKAFDRGYVPEQVLVAEENLGRFLKDGEEVIHINGNAKDNRPENLKISQGNNRYLALSSERDFLNKPYLKYYIPCKYQQPCWKTVRSPLVRKNKIYLPYVCSFQTQGDIYKCSHYWTFKEEEVKEGEDKIE